MSELTEFRAARDQFMGHDHQSPLADEQRRSFTGLTYFDEAPGLRLVLDVRKAGGQEVVEMQTSTGDAASYVRWGKVEFEVGGETAELTLYRDPHGHDYFLPFADATSGNETYGAGRYLEVQELGDSRVVLDFNYAYNPYCAYNEHWSCPLTPSENRLHVPIRAGEKSFK
jgi:uncharacterized protein (DUF1684 family)